MRILNVQRTKKPHHFPLFAAHLLAKREKESAAANERAREPTGYSARHSCSSRACGNLSSAESFPLFSCRETLARQRRRRRLQRQEQNFTRSITIISVAFFTTCPRLLFQQSFLSFLPNNKKKHTHT